MNRLQWLAYFTMISILLWVVGCPKTQTTPETEAVSTADAGTSSTTATLTDGGAIVDDPPAAMSQTTRTPEELFTESMQVAETNPTEAIQLLQKLVAQKPSLYQAWYNMGVLHHRKGNYTESENAYRKTLEIKPDFQDAIINLTRLYLSRNQTSQALNFVESKLSQYPNHSSLRNELIYLYTQRGEYQRSEQMARAIQQKEEKNARVILNLGLVWYGQKKYELAQMAFDRSSKIDKTLADAHYYLGFTHIKLSRQMAAISAFEEAIRVRPHFPEAHNMLGVLYLKQPGKVPAAIESFRKALQYSPQYKEAQLNLGIAFNSSGQHQEAADQFTLVLQQNIGYIEPHYYLGILHLDHNLKRQNIAIGAIAPEVPASLHHDGNILRQVSDIARYMTAVGHLRTYIGRKTGLASDAPVHQYLQDAEKRMGRERSKLQRLIKRITRQRLRDSKKKTRPLPPPPTPRPTAIPTPPAPTPRTTAPPPGGVAAPPPNPGGVVAPPPKRSTP